MPPSSTPPAKGAPETTEKAPESASAPSGGFKAWLPLLANLVLMPVLAYGTFQFLILPKLGKDSAITVSAKGAAHGDSKDSVSPRKHNVPLSAKILVNVAGTMGTRYLLASVTLVSTSPELQSLVELNDAELRDAAASALSVKTISDLEKPGSRNLIRTELISVFNNILGGNAVTDLYLTEFAIQ